MVGHEGADHLDGTAGEAELQGPQGRLAGHSEDLVGLGGDHAGSGGLEEALAGPVASGAGVYFHRSIPLRQL